jgi:photosystem II stability/assembly factor-like uncharacterized protein
MPWRRSILALALLLIVVLTSACGTTFARRTPTATPVLTPPPLTIKPAHPLVWTAHQLPPGLKLTQYNWDGPALTQSDGDTAYLCQLMNGQAQVWATHDRAEHWTMAGSVPVASGMTECYIAVDAMKPRQALLRTYKFVCCAVVSYESRIYLTTDGGVTWTPRDAPAEETPLFSTLASLGGVSYILAGTIPHSACSACYSALYRSKDGMRTWTRIDADIFLMSGSYSERYVSRFWLGLAGELLAYVTNNGPTVGSELWRSSDQGKHWSLLGNTGNANFPNDFVVQGNQGTHFWRACAQNETAGDYTHPPTQRISCTLDGGATWLDTGGDNTYDMDVFAQATDGAVLAVTPSPVHGKVGRTITRTIPGRSTWESLGSPPSSVPIGQTPKYVAVGETGVLWLMKQPASYGEPLTTIYTATYP